MALFPLTVPGDERLLRRLVRNLLENARRHGGGPVEARLSALGNSIRLAVLDRGHSTWPQGTQKPVQGMNERAKSSMRWVERNALTLTCSST